MTTLHTTMTDAALGTVGDLILHAQRGVLRDALAAYARLLAHAGRTLTDEPPKPELVPFEDPPRHLQHNPAWQRVADGRVLAVVDILGIALRGSHEHGPEAGWRNADACFKGWALLHADSLAGRQTALRTDATDALDGGNLETAATIDQEIERLADLEQWYRNWAGGVKQIMVRVNP